MHANRQPHESERRRSERPGREQWSPQLPHRSSHSHCTLARRDHGAAANRGPQGIRIVPTRTISAFRQDELRSPRPLSLRRLNLGREGRSSGGSDASEDEAPELTTPAIRRLGMSVRTAPSAGAASIRSTSSSTSGANAFDASFGCVASSCCPNSAMAGVGTLQAERVVAPGRQRRWYSTTNLCNRSRARCSSATCARR